MSVYSFDTKIAELVGVNAATIYYNLEFWLIRTKPTSKTSKTVITGCITASMLGLNYFHL